MKCPDSADLALWLEGRLPREETLRIKAHVDACLACRFVVGTDSLDRDAASDPDTQEEGGVPFELIRGRLREAFDSSESAPQSVSFGDEVVYEEDVLLAADSESGPSNDSIPSYITEGGNLVVTFRIDPATQVVTAHLVGREPEQIAFRATQFGERVFVSDAHGKVVLTGMREADLVGLRVAVPPPLGSASLDHRTVPTGGGALPLTLLDATGSAASVGVDVRVLPTASGSECRFALGGAPVGCWGLVIVFDETDAHFVPFAEDGMATIPCPRILLGTMRVTLVALS